MRSRAAGLLGMKLTLLLACGDDSSPETEPDASGQPPADASIAVDGGGDAGSVDAGPRACGELVAEVDGDVSALAVDGSRLYWREIADEGVTFIKRSNKGGGVVDIAAFELGSIIDFVVADDTVAYSEPGGVWVVPPVGDRVRLSDVGGFRGQIAADADRVYWVEPLQPRSGRVVLARPKDASTEAVEIPIDFDEDGAIEDLAVDDAGLYFFDGVNSAAMRAPREGGVAQPLGTSGRSTIEELAVIGEHVYWRTQGDGIQGGPIYRAPRDQVPGDEAQLVAELSDVRGIKVHAGFLYAVDERLGLKRFPVDGENPSGDLVEEEITNGSFVASDVGIFFWSRAGESGSIRLAPLTGCR